MSGFVLGFSDEAAQIAGLAWSLSGHEGALVALAGKLSGPGSAASSTGDSFAVEATVGDRSVSVEASASEWHELLADPLPPGSPSAALGQAEVRIGGPDERLTCSSTITRWAGDPADGAELVRHLGFPAAGGGAIVMVACRPEGAEDHASEAAWAWQLDRGDGPKPFVEALLSTQYDSEGLPSRAGLELWPDDPDAPATRAAGSRPVTAVFDGVTVALMHTSAEGFPGVGGYLIVRP